MSIEPLSKIPVSSIREFLVSNQHEPAVIDWKYFDHRFNDGRERGFACIDEGRVVSFIGLIPFTVVQNGRRVEAAWSCDWHRDPNASGPLGIMLIRHSLKAYPFIYASGGSEMTKAIMSRLSSLTVPTSGIELYKPLRLGGVIYLIQRATRLQRLPSFKALSTVKLPRRNRKSDKTVQVELLDRLPDNINDLFRSLSLKGHFPTYESAYVRWLLERCPSITGGVCLVSRGGEAVGAILFWHPKGGLNFWRMCVLSPNEEFLLLEAGIERTINHICDNGGQLVSLMASQLDKTLLNLAGRLGFYQSNARRPLYVLTREPNTVPEELQGLTYLDTDYAYRFPVMTD